MDKNGNINETLQSEFLGEPLQDNKKNLLQQNSWKPTWSPHNVCKDPRKQTNQSNNDSKQQNNYTEPTMARKIMWIKKTVQCTTMAQKWHSHTGEELLPEACKFRK